MNDQNEKLAAFRHEIDEVSELLARLGRRKANNTDVAELAEKVSLMETDYRGKFDTVHADLQATNNNLRRLAHALENMQTAQAISEPPATPAPAGLNLGFRAQLIVYTLAGVGILALLQGAPHALATLMPGLAR